MPSNAVLSRGTSPLLISIPHLGTEIPPDILATMTPVAQHRDDTDWHLDQLYSFASELGASILQPRLSRYVIDLNRPPNDENLYPGQNTTGLLPVDTFADEALYAEVQRPTEQERDRRRALYWDPYHQTLVAELARLRQEHGYALLWEAHSIRAYLPRLFEGRLHDFNFGSASDHSALPGLAQELAVLASAGGHYTAVANGRFKGGYITRHYGQPQQHVHAIQLELAQLCYMDESRPYHYDVERASKLAPKVRQCIEHALHKLHTHYQ